MSDMDAKGPGNKGVYENIRPLRDPSAIFDMSGRIGLIVGGCGRMGQEFAQTLMGAGAIVILADQSAPVCEMASNTIMGATGKQPPTCVCDVSAEEDVIALFSRIEREFGRLDFFVSNVMAKPAGYYLPFQDYSLETWKRVHDTNLTGTFLCCKQAAKLMEKHKQGSIVITSSIYGLVSPDFRVYQDCSPVENPYGGHDPLTTPAAYVSSKGGLISLARYLAVLLAPKNIRVNVLTPGGVYDNQEDAFHRAYIERTPLRRMAVWSDYNGAILFLVSDASRYMTGANLVVDGGWTAW